MTNLRGPKLSLGRAVDPFSELARLGRTVNAALLQHLAPRQGPGVLPSMAIKTKPPPCSLTLCVSNHGIRHCVMSLLPDVKNELGHEGPANFDNLPAHGYRENAKY